MSKKLQYQPSYRRNLPHIQPEGATFFVTTRLHGSLPEAAWQRLQAEREQRRKIIEQSAGPDDIKRAQLYDEDKRAFGRYDALLDAASDGPVWLSDPRVAELVCRAIHYRQGDLFDLIAYCVMPNHAHLVFTPRPRADKSYFALAEIMHGFKGYTGWKANELLGLREHFWQHESYDHYVRDGRELARIVDYVLWNPVKAGLTDSWEKWPWSYWCGVEG